MNIFSTSVFAHSPRVEVVEGTLLKYSFSDGSLMVGAKIIVQDGNGESIGSGKTAKDGTYDYGEYAENAYTIKSNDGEGHMTTYEVPASIRENQEGGQALEGTEPETNEPSATANTNKLLGIGLVVIILGFVFNIKRKAKK